MQVTDGIAIDWISNHFSKPILLAIASCAAMTKPDDSNMFEGTKQK
jgi:hypothetical protein